MKKTHTRNPSGVVSSKPIALRLLPEERAQADRLAKESGHSVSAIARKAYLQGIPAVAAELKIALRNKNRDPSSESSGKDETLSCNTDRTTKR